MAKKISSIISINQYFNLNKYKLFLEEAYKNARDGKDPNCKKCNDYGVIEKGVKSVIGGKELYFDTKCDCIKNDRSTIYKQLEELNLTIKQFRNIFGTIDENMTLDSFADKYNQSELVNMLKTYLNISSNASLYLHGVSGSGKTTILKMLWQIYMINKVKVFFFKASYFEKLHKQLYSSNAPKDLQSSIQAKLDNVKKCDILLIDDIGSIGFASAVNGYYEIFDYLRKTEKKVIITSNKSVETLMSSLREKKDTDSLRMADRLISRMLGIGVLQIEVKRNDSIQKVLIKRKEQERMYKNV